MPNVFVDCEGGPAPSVGIGLREFGAVIHPTMKAFHGKIQTKDGKVFENEITADDVRETVQGSADYVFLEFDLWLARECKGLGAPKFVSDNPAYDWQFINDGFWRILGRNPFGFSARRIGDFYSGLVGDWYRTQAWKKLRITRHNHHPVNDALGNCEAWVRLLEGERPDPYSTKAEKKRYY